MRRAPSLTPLILIGLTLIAAPAAARLPFVPPPAAASAPVALPGSAPWFVLQGELPAERLLGALIDSPVQGTARYELRMSAPLPQVGLTALVDVPDLRVGERLLGRMRLRIFAPLGGDGLLVRIELDGPAGQLSGDLALPERFDPGVAAVEALLEPLGALVHRPDAISESSDAIIEPSDTINEPSDAMPEPPDAIQVPSGAIATPDDDMPGLLDAIEDIQAAAADWPGAPTMRLRFESFDLDRLTDLWPDLALAGRATGALALDAGGLRGRIEAIDAAWRGGPLGTARIELDIQPRATHIRASAGRAPTAVQLDVQIPADFDPRRLTMRWRDAEPVALSLTARGLTPGGVAALHRFHPAADFDAELTLTAAGALHELQVVGRLSGVLVDGSTTRPLAGTLDVGPTDQSLQFTIGAPDAPLMQLDLATAADLVALRRTDAGGAASTLTGALVAVLPLRTLMPYLPAAIDDPRGDLTGRIDAAGTLGAPQLTGGFGITDGEATLVAANARLHDLDLDLRFEGETARIETLRARSGRGTLAGSGSARWTMTPAESSVPLWSAWAAAADFQLTLDDMPLVRPGLPAGLLDAGVRVVAQAAPGSAAVDVIIEGTDLRLTGFQLAGAQPIARNGAVRRRSQGTLRRADAWLAGEGDLTLTLQMPDGRIEGQQTALRFGGALTVRRVGDDFTVEGAIETRTGAFRLFDNPFTLDGGRFTIQGGTLDPRAAVAVAIGQAQLAEVDTAPAAEALDPIIDLRAEGQVVETTVRVRIVGPSQRPSLILESDPPLPEYQILTLLITGRVDAIDERNGEVRRQAARLIDQFHNPSLARQLYDRLGVDKLGLKFGASVTNPILTVGKQINRRLYVETVYHHDAPPDANEKEARVEYRLSPRWTVDTVAGDAGEGSLGLFWQTSFGRPVAPAVKPDAGDEPGDDGASEGQEAGQGGSPSGG